MKRELIHTLLKSESNLVESNYMKYITVTDNEIKAKINNIRLTLAGLGKIKKNINIVTMMI